MIKKELRKKIIKNRDFLDLIIRKNNNEIILNKLLESQIYKNSTNIFTFISYGSEVDTKAFIISALSSGKKIFVPKTIKGTKEMKAIEIKSLNDLKEDSFGILEPNTFDFEIDKNLLDLVIVPGVAFDENGNRIGYGGGYYDRYLLDLDLHISKVAIAYEIQLVEFIETEIHDVSVDYVITEKKVIVVK